MRANLTFFSLLSGLIATLLFSLPRGLEVSAFMYLAGSHALFSRELARLRERIERTTRELPDRVNGLVPAESDGPDLFTHPDPLERHIHARTAAIGQT